MCNFIGILFVVLAVLSKGPRNKCSVTKLHLYYLLALNKKERSHDDNSLVLEEVSKTQDV